MLNDEEKAVKQLSDYNFTPEYPPNERNINSGQEYIVTMDLDDLKKGDVVKFVGFDDVDNHHGIFVFVDTDNRVLEVSGDCSGPNNTCVRNLKLALSIPL